METRDEVKTIQVDYKCPKCETGYLRPTGMVYDCSPPSYPHRCTETDCDYGTSFSIRYPKIEYERIGSIEKLLRGI